MRVVALLLVGQLSLILTHSLSTDGAVVKLHRAKCIADTMEHVQRVRDMVMNEAGEECNTTTTSFLEIGNPETLKKRFGFKVCFRGTL